MLEVVYSLPEERNAEQAAVVVFEQQPGGGERRERKHSTQTALKDRGVKKNRKPKLRSEGRKMKTPEVHVGQKDGLLGGRGARTSRLESTCHSKKKVSCLFQLFLQVSRQNVQFQEQSGTLRDEEKNIVSNYTRNYDLISAQISY